MALSRGAAGPETAACRAVKRPLSQGSLTRAGKHPRFAAALDARQMSGVFRVRPAPPSPGLRPSWPAIGRATPTGHRSCPGHRRRPLKAHHEGAVDALLQAPEQEMAPAPSLPSPPGNILMVPISCSASRCGCQARRVDLAGRFQIGGQGRPARTAHTPDAGRGAVLITAQSPLAKRDVLPPLGSDRCGSAHRRRAADQPLQSKRALGFRCTAGWVRCGCCRRRSR